MLERTQHVDTSCTTAAKKPHIDVIKYIGNAVILCYLDNMHRRKLSVTV